MSEEYGNVYNNSKGFDSVFKITENGSYLIRFISGVKQINRVWVPVLLPNEDGGYDESWRAFVVIRDETIFKKLADLHIKGQIDAGIKESEARSPFQEQPVHAYLIFNRNADKLKVEVGEFKWSVRKELQDLSTHMDLKDTSKYRHGPFYMWDAEVIRKKDDKTGRIKYSVVPYENKFSGRVPRGFTVDDPVKKGIFTAAEMEAINNFKTEQGITKFEEFWPSHESNVYTTEDIIAWFSTSGHIDFNRTRGGAPIFNKVESLLPELQSANIRFVLGENTSTSEKDFENAESSGESKQDDNWGFADDKSKVEDAEFEEVKPEELKEEPKKEELKEEPKETPKEEPKEEKTNDGDDW